ncbi:MAG: hypothetical protein FJ087_18715 [Deltaproteobacteria bacterium]|nr:hypothetical protein [Deltaproteobacteria bacterium]
MSVVATVLYEDKMRPIDCGSYPLHDLVMRIVEDDIDGETWRLRKRVDRNARKGIGNILNDLGRTDLIAGAGRLFVLVDRDRIAAHLGVAADSSDAGLQEALRARSDAPDKVQLFFLLPNMEGLLGAIHDCDGSVASSSIQGALAKNLNDRDIVLNGARKAERRALRDCVRARQPGLDALARSIAALVGQEAVAP